MTTRRVMGSCLLPALLAIFLGSPCWAQGKSPFAVRASLSTEGARTNLSVTFIIPQNCHLYADRMSVTALDGAVILATTVPAAKIVRDTFSDSDARIYDRDVTFAYSVQSAPGNVVDVDVEYQGCNETLCFLPQKERHRAARVGASPRATPEQETNAPTVSVPPSPASWQATVKAHFVVSGRTSGYVESVPFTAFLEQAQTGSRPQSDSLADTLRTRGMWVALLVILVFGLALNLTPCVLPMIPVNIAIIGAGVHAGSRRRGFALGSAYGLGIAIVYGILGLLVILSGARFGALNSSPWFNAAIAGVFLVMSLGMFDLIPIDFSRFQTSVGTGTQRKGSYVASFLLGGIAALLAGACVAPVVISVLLLSTGMYASGHPSGLLLPFVLGLGMALPWPFAGAGLSFLPKPGRWMERVKVAFGIVILLAAAWYGYLAFSLFRDRTESGRQAVIAAEERAAKEGWHTSLPDAIEQAQRESRPVFIDFWASWCKNCLRMDGTTFRDPEVRRQLDRFVKVKYRAEDLGEPQTKAALDAFDVVGLPTYVVLKPVGTAESR